MGEEKAKHMRFLEVVYYDAFYDGIFVLFCNVEMLGWIKTKDESYMLLEVSLITDEI